MTSIIPKFETLYKIKNNKIYQWNIDIEKINDNLYRLNYYHGQKDGKMTLYTSDICKGKKKRTILEQAILETNKRWADKKEIDFYSGKIDKSNSNSSNLIKKIEKNIKNPMIEETSFCKIAPIDTDTEDPILHAIQHFKVGGISVLEKLNETTLIDMLVKTNEVYRNLGPGEIPLVTDNQYDILEDYIKKKYPDNKFIGKIGAPVEKNKIKLPYEMASMDKIKPDTKALSSWLIKYNGPYILSCKLDGVSGLYTTEGTKPKLYTRGDGKIGQDVSHFIPYLKLPKEKDIVVRGEFIMLKDVFQTKYADTYANARNLIAGTINRISVSDTVQDMDFVAYELISPSLKPSEQLKKLKELGFNTVQYKIYKNISNEEISTILVDWRNNYIYETDGVIVSDDKIYPRKSGNPNHSFAFKMVLSDQIAETKVLDVEWNASKDGYLKPRVQLEPIYLNGVKIEFATGFNAAFIKQNRIGVGSLIQIIRSGDVIPYIKSVITPAEQGLMPTIPYIWNESLVDIILKNKDDNYHVREKIITGFFKGIEVDGLGSGNISRIIEAGFETIPQILNMSKDDFLTIEGFQEKMADKLHNGIADKIKEASLSSIMSASNMIGRGFSDKKIELILEEYPDILTSNEDIQVKINKLSNVKGMASKTAKAFVENIPKFLEFLEDCNLLSKISLKEIPKNTKINVSHPLYKKSIVMSGSRDKELEKLLLSIGALLGTSVTSKTFAVITPDIDSETGKVATAKKLEIQVLTPIAFKDKFLK